MKRARKFARTFLPILLVGTLIVCSEEAGALNPDLDLSQYAHTTWRVRDGFTGGGIKAIAQTPDGYLWLGSESGLSRFDGVRNIPWEPPDGQQLPGKFISALLVSRDGALWIGTFQRGLARWKNGRLTTYPELAGRYISVLIEDHEGTVWIGSYDVSGDDLCAFKAGSIRCSRAEGPGLRVTALYEDHRGNLWVSASTGLWRWAPGSPELYKYPHGVTRATSLIEDDAGTLLLATNQGLKQLAGRKILDYRLPDVSPPFVANFLFRSSDGSLWITTTQGLLHLHRKRTDRFSIIEGLSEDSSGIVIEDREGNVWVGTAGGLDRFREFAIPTVSRKEGISGVLTAVQESPDGSIWSAGTNGVSRWANGDVTVFSPRTGLAETLRTDERKSGSEHLTKIPNSGLEGIGQALGLNGERLWASTNEGVFRFEGGRFVRVPGIPGGTTLIAGDGHGGWWIANANMGLFYWSPTSAVQQIPWSQFQQKFPRTLAPDPVGAGLWLGFLEGGIAYFDDGRVRTSYGAAQGLGSGRVNHLRFDSSDTLWAATEDGLSRIKDGHISTLTSKNGLPCDEVHWSMEDGDHAFWLYMPCGLVRIKQSDLNSWVSDARHVVKPAVFDSSDGVRKVGIYGTTGPLVTKSPDGRIWFVPYDGVSLIDPQHLQFNKIPPPVHIEGIVADSREYNSLDGLRLPAHVQHIEMDYTALSLVAPEKNRFRFKLEGYDSDWRDVGNRRQAFYTHLEPRTYRFRVVACNNSGVWNETGASLEFSIAPAYYQTTWFRALCVAAFAGLLWVLYQLRLRQIRRQFAVGMEERVGERLRIARELHDTLLQSFQGAVFQFQAARRLQLRKADNAMQVMDEAVVAAEQAITEGRAAISDLRPEPVAHRTLPELLNAAGQELSGTHELNGSSPNFRVIVEGKQQILPPILQDEVYRISREVVRNAFKHASASHIEVEIRYDEDQLRLRIRDDGKGIDPKILEAGGQSGHFGIPGIRERAERIGSRLEFWSEVGAGTEVELAVPAAMAYPKRRDGRRFRLFRRAGSDGQRS